MMGVRGLAGVCRGQLQVFARPGPDPTHPPGLSRLGPVRLIRGRGRVPQVCTLLGPDGVDGGLLIDLATDVAGSSLDAGTLVGLEASVLSLAPNAPTQVAVAFTLATALPADAEVRPAPPPPPFLPAPGPARPHASGRQIRVALQQPQQIIAAGCGELLDNRRLVHYARYMEAQHAVHPHPEQAVPRPATHLPRRKQQRPHHVCVPALAGEVETRAVLGGRNEEQICSAHSQQLSDDVEVGQRAR